VGGIWKSLPAWQDIQNRKADFAINDVPLHGVKQPDVLQYVREWVERYDLASSIRVQHEVTSVVWQDNEWRVQTSRGGFRARFLIVASGAQNRPFIPDVRRSDSKILEFHSSSLRRPQDLADRRVVVVGGGTSAWDLLDLALENDARAVDWVYRSTKWCMPTTQSKQTFWPNLREMAVVQEVTGSTEATSAFLRWLTRQFYERNHVTEIEPAERLDIRRHQLIPGRSRMIRDFDAISRHRSEVRQLRGHEVALANGERLETDAILWGTGFRMSLRYLGLPEYREIETLDELRPRLGSLIRSTDYPNMFFMGMSLLDSTSSTPFLAAIEARTTVAHILGRCTVPKKNLPHLVAYWDLFEHFAAFDRENYPRFWWKLKYFLLAFWYVVFQRKQVKI
jgi:cation diffusion facilitator CzcD-associated flavoprotein CzcO